jgi:hypothetical protein
MTHGPPLLVRTAPRYPQARVVRFHSEPTGDLMRRTTQTQIRPDPLPYNGIRVDPTDLRATTALVGLQSAATGTYQPSTPAFRVISRETTKASRPIHRAIARTDYPVFTPVEISTRSEIVNTRRDTQTLILN